MNILLRLNLLSFWSVLLLISAVYYLIFILLLVLLFIVAVLKLFLFGFIWKMFHQM